MLTRRDVRWTLALMLLNCRSLTVNLSPTSLSALTYSLGYLLHQFLSPAANKGSDLYGGSFENRIRPTIEVVREVRAVIPAGMPLFCRLSVTDWLEPGVGWESQDSVILARALLAHGVDLIDASSSGLDQRQKIPIGPAFQAPLAQMIKEQVPEMLTGAVGLIYNADLATKITEGKQADAVLIAREFSRNPSFVLDLAKELGVKVKYPVQLHRIEPGYSR